MRNPTPNTPTAIFWARFDLSFGATCAREAEESSDKTAGKSDIVGAGVDTATEANLPHGRAKMASGGGGGIACRGVFARVRSARQLLLFL